MPDSPARVTSMVCHYAAYLRARAHVTPEVSVDGNRAEVRLGVGAKVLVAIFGYRKKNWSLRSVEVRRGEQATTFTRGELAKAVAALLGRRAPGTRATGGQRRLGAANRRRAPRAAYHGDPGMNGTRIPGLSAGRCRRVIFTMAGMACGALLAAGGERG
jgi:hypothetical protein